MSTTIDQKVVEMQFDNKHFEQNVQTSMSTLDKLKQSLKLDDAAKGFDKVSAAAGKVDMSGLGNAVDNVRSRFSALEVMGVTALANITNSAVNAGKRMLSSLTIKPITTGFNEYELKMDSVKTIMASTGESVETVNKYLNELNEYSDQTIYSFADMTQNIGKFTNAGVKLEDAVLAIKGISNEAAISGANANEASRAMYNFAQSLSSGYVKLIDWKSIENANMATKEFKEQLIKTAVELETVTESADGMYKTLDGHDFNATKNFNDVLQDQWMTSEVLIKTLGKYAVATTDIGKKAFAAAQDVTKFSQVWDILRETAQSGWARTWEIVIGDINQAKALLTPFTNFLSGIINSINDARNNLLGGALNGGNLWKSIKSKFDQSGLGKIVNGIETVSNTVTKTKRSLEEFQGIVNKVWRGDYGNSDTGRFEKLDSEGWDHRVVQDLVNKGHAYKLTMDDIEASHEKFGLTMEQTTETTKETSTAIAGLTDEQLKNAGLTDEEIKLYRDLEAEAKRTGKTIDEIADKMSKKDGRTLLIESFKNAGQGLVAILKAIKDAWREIFPPMSVVRLYSIIEGINNFSKHLRVSDDTAENLKRTLKGVFAVFNLITFFVGGAFRIAFKIVSTILGAFDLNILDLTAIIGDAIVAFVDWIKSLFNFESIIKKVAGLVVSAAKAIKKWFNAIKESGVIQKFTEWVVKSVKALRDWFAGLKNTKVVKGVVSYLKEAWKNLKKWFSGMKDTEDLPKYIFDGICKGLKFGFKTLGGVLKYVGKFIFDAIKKIPGMSEWFDSLKESDNIARDIILGLIKGLGSGLSMIWNAAVKLASTLWEAVKEFLGIHSPSTKFIEIGKNIIEGLIEGVRWGAEKVMSVFGAIIEPVINWIKSLDLGKIFAIALAGGSIWFLKQVGDLIGGLGRFLDSLQEVTKSLKKVGNSLSTALKAEAMKAFATSILILVAAIAILTLLDPVKMWSAVGALVLIMGELIAMSWLMGRSSKESWKGILDFAGLVAALAGLMFVLAYVTKMLSEVEWSDMGKTGVLILALGGIIVGLVFLAKYISKNYKILASLSQIGKTMVRIGATFVLFAIALKIIAGMSEDDTKRASAVILGFAGIIAGLMSMTKWIGGNDKSISSIGKTLTSVGIALLLMAVVMAIVNDMSWTEIGKGLAVIGAFSGIIVGLMAATRLIGGSKNIEHIGKTIAGVGVAIFLMGLTMLIIKDMSIGDIAKGELAIAGFAAIISGLIYATKLAGGEKKIKSLGKNILLISVAIAILAAVAVILSLINPADLWNGVGAVGALSAMVGGLMYMTKYTKKSTGTIIALAAVIGVLAAAVYVLSTIDKDALYRATGAIGILMGMFSGMILSTSKSKKSLGTIIVLGLVVAAIAAILWAMSELDVKNSVENAAALSTVLVAMTGCLAVLTKMKLGNKTVQKQAKGGIKMLTAMIIPLAAFAVALWLLPDLSGRHKDVITLVGVLGAMTLLLAPLTAIGKWAGWKSLIGVVALTSMVAPLIAFAFAISILPDIPESKIGGIKILAQVLAAATLLLIPLSLIGLLGWAPFVGVAALAAMVAPLALFAWAISELPDVSKHTPSITALMNMMSQLTDMLVKISLVAPLAMVAVGSMLAFEGVILAFGVIVTAVGWLITEVPVIGDFIDTGIPIMVKLAEGIGQMVGAFVTAVAESAFNLLPKLGTALTDFVTNAEDFIEFAKGDDISKATAGALELAKVIAAFIAVEFLDGITRFIGGSSNFAEFGTKLTDFVKAAKPGLDAMANVPTTTLTKVTKLTDALMTITGAQLMQQISDFLSFGSDDESNSFKTKMTELADGLVAFATVVSDPNISFDTEHVGKAIEAVTALSEATKNLEEDWYVKLFGFARNDEEVYGNGLEALAAGLEAMNEFGKSLPQDSTYMQGIERATKAFKILSEATTGLEEDWYVKLFPFARNDEGVYGNGLDMLSAGLTAMDAAGSSITEANVTNACACLTALVTATNTIKDESWYTKLGLGISDETSYSVGLSALGKGIKAFHENAKGVKLENIKGAIAAFKQIATTPVPDAEWFAQLTLGKSNEEVFGNGLAALGEGVKSFYDSVKDLTIAENKVKAACDAIAQVAAIEIPKTSIIDKLLPWAESDAEVFSEGMTSLANGLAAFNKVVVGTDNPESKSEGLFGTIGAVSSITAAASSVTDGTKIDKAAIEYAAECIGIIAGITIPKTSIIDKLLPWAESDAEVFSEGMTSLANGISSFNSVVSADDFKLNQDAIKNACDSIGVIAQIPVPDAGLIAKLMPWTKDNTTIFADGMSSLAEGLFAFNYAATGGEITIGGTKITSKPLDQDAIKYAADCIGIIAGIQIPQASLITQLIPWAKDSTTLFAEGMETLATGLFTFNHIACGGKITIGKTDVTPKPLDKSRIVLATSCLELLAALTVPEASLIAQLLPFAKDNTQVFGEGLGALGEGLILFNNAVCGEGVEFDMDKLKAAAEALTIIAGASIPDAGFLTQLGVLKSDEETFATGLSALGKGLRSFYDSVSGETFDEDVLTSAVDAISRIGDIATGTPPSAENTAAWKDFLNDFGTGIGTFCEKAGGLTVDLATNISRLGIAAKHFNDLDCTKIDSFGDALKNIAEADSDALISVCKAYSEKMVTVAEDMIASFVSGVSENLSKANTAATSMVEGSIEAAKEATSGMVSAGEDLGDGLVKGIESKKQAAYDAGYALGQEAVKGEKAGQDSASPSKLTIKAGKWLGEGLVIGMERMGRSVYNAGYDLGSTATDSISRTISRIANIVNTDIDSQPTIRPVLDLSDVKTGAGLIYGLLNTGSVIGVSANVGAINSMMNNRVQNGTNDDVVSAIDKLRGDLGNVGNTSYNINGITYDDGSNIASAVETLIRAARIERRV